MRICGEGSTVEHACYVLLVALAEDLGSVLSTHMIAHGHLKLQFWGSQWPLLAFSVCIQTLRHMHIIEF